MSCCSVPSWSILPVSQYPFAFNLSNQQGLMYFHSSSSRHEQYANIRKQQRNHQQKQPRTSTCSIGTDSGYNSPTSPQLDPQNAKEEPLQDEQQTQEDDQDNASTTCSFVTDTTLDSTSERPKKKRTKKKKYLDQPPRQPDFVYSCPRPLAFPFHNDCHFLPVAEADPRDVARIAPPRRMPSLESTKAGSTTSSITSQRSPYRSGGNSNSSTRTSTSSTQGSIRLDDDDDVSISTSQQSRPASLISTVQQGTVRSLRSLFQLSTKTDDRQTTTTTTTTSDRLPKLESKVGTVASLRKLFSRPQSTEPSPSPPTPPQQQSVSPFSRSVLSKSNKNVKHNGDDSDMLTAINTAKNSQSGNKTKNLFFAPPGAARFEADRRDTSPSRPPVIPKPSFSSETSSSSLSSSSPPAASSLSPPPPPHSPAKESRRSFFASFRRSSTSSPPPPPPPKDTKQQADRMMKSTTVGEEELANIQQQPTTTVGRIWKSFKRLVGGNKSSRVGVI
ncbi:hypothetical protein BC941DRAFT_497263 [Chlamydoabsidia padenii]|nr:hypothetical protein BC941DRAFT_497263 [Chlamydoabsidia padenii]